MVARLVDLYMYAMYFFFVGWQSEICAGKTGVATHLFIELFGYGDQIHCRSYCWQAALRVHIFDAVVSAQTKANQDRQHYD